MRYFDHIDIGKIPTEHPVAVFNSLWTELELEHKPVPWNAVKPEAAATAIPWLLLLEPRPDGRYYYRICGTGCEMLFGRPHEGGFFGEDMPQDAINKRLEEFDVVQSGGGPLLSETTLPMEGKENREIYRGVFGFTSDGETVDKIGVVVAPKKGTI